MKKTMVSLFAAAMAMLSIASASAQTLNIEQPHIVVRGTAKTTIEPNKIEVAIRLFELPSKVKNTLSEQEKQLATALTEAGVDMKSQLVVVSQSTSSDKRKVSYQHKNYLLTLTTAEELAEVFAAFDAHGIQSANVTRVSNSDQDATKMEMRVQAMQNARTIAETLAGAVGQKIGDAIVITDNSVGGGPVFSSNDFVMMRASSEPEEVSMPRTLQMRAIEVEQNVSVRFILLPRVPVTPAK